MSRPDPTQRNLVINLNKPKDISSQKAVTKVKHLFAVRKAGHAGTLDPIATGVLIVCLNEATKITRFISDLDKEYMARLKLGERTDTYDLTGKIIGKRDFSLIKETDIHKVLNNFTGRIKQTPPMYSAIKIGGQPLYKLARLGMNLERPERTVNIYKIDLAFFNPPYLDLKISCSKGTYIRTLCDDIGNALGVGAHMVSLERTRIGRFRIEDSTSIDKVNCNKDACHSIDSAISHLQEIKLDEDSYYKAQNGIPIILSSEALAKVSNEHPPQPLPSYLLTDLPSPASLCEAGRAREGNTPLHLDTSRNRPSQEGIVPSPLAVMTRRGEPARQIRSDGGKGEGGLYGINQYVRLKSPENILFGIGRVKKNRVVIERLLN
jgi:tRNA pseudouridine55 synthase